MEGFDLLEWVVFEGIDGSGKTTQAKLFSQFLSTRGVANEYRHVFDTNTGRKLRELFINSTELGNRLEILLLAGARDQFIRHVVLREPRWKRLLITDGFFLSIEAMQGLSGHSDLDLIHYLKSLILQEIQPDLHILIDVPADVCSKRLNDKPKYRTESMGIKFHEKVRGNYLRILATEKNILRINGDQSIVQVHSDIIQGVRGWLRDHREFLRRKHAPKDEYASLS